MLVTAYEFTGKDEVMTKGYEVRTMAGVVASDEAPNEVFMFRFKDECSFDSFGGRRVT